VYVTNVVSPFNQCKIPPLMPVLMQTFQIDLTQAGLFMSIIAIIGLMLALPTGIILQRLGPKVMLLIARGFDGNRRRDRRSLRKFHRFADKPGASEFMQKPEWAGLGLAMVLAGQNFGQLLGPIFFGEIVKSSGWAMAGYLMIPFCLLGFISGWLVKIR
jgi:predicted MFS family arabinose efflux permease